MIIEKPWGNEEVIEINEKYMFKLLTMYKNHRCSLQYHNYKTETIYVKSGKLRIYIGESPDNLNSSIYKSGDVVTIKPGTIHRMEAIEDCQYFEASSPEIDDVVRLEDDYRKI